MTRAKAGQLRIGDFVRFADELHEVAGLDGVTVILVAESGRRMAVTSAALLGDSTFELVDSRRRRRPLPPVYFESLPAELRLKGAVAGVACE